MRPALMGLAAVLSFAGPPAAQGTAVVLFPCSPRRDCCEASLGWYHFLLPPSHFRIVCWDDASVDDVLTARVIVSHFRMKRYPSAGFQALHDERLLPRLGLNQSDVPIGRMVLIHLGDEDTHHP